MRKRKGKERNRNARFLMLDYCVFDSDAYRALRPAPRALLFELIRLFNGRNNGKIFLSTRDALRLVGLNDPHAVIQAFAELQAHGLIALAEPGYFSVKLSHASCWELTFLAVDGRPPSRLYEKWRPKPGSREQDRLDRLRNCKLRQGNTQQPAGESPTLPSIPVAAEASTVGVSLTPLEQFQCDADQPDVRESPAHLDIHTGRPPRASLIRCNQARARIGEWLMARGGRTQKVLAGLAGIQPSTLSRFIRNRGGRCSLPEPDLARLLEAMATSAVVPGYGKARQ